MEWVFGYGSLIWRPAFDFEHRHAAVLHGWRRRFWQGSTDHRGVPGAPGRVVTLVPEPGAITYGVVFRVAEERRDDVGERLDHREQGGYERHRLRVRLADGSLQRAVTWVAGEHNEHFLGPAPLDRIAEQVRGAVGPSGPNVEYVLRLAEALRALGAGEDDEVFALEALLGP